MNRKYGNSHKNYFPDSLINGAKKMIDISKKLKNKINKFKIQYNKYNTNSK